MLKKKFSRNHFQKMEFFDVEESDQEEELEVKEEAEEDNEDEADPEFSEAFQREELGPPEVSDEALERFDERATKKETNRLVAMGVLQEVTASSNEDPDLPEVQEQEYIWLTTKFVYDWRFTEARKDGCEEQDWLQENTKSSRREMVYFRQRQHQL